MKHILGLEGVHELRGEAEGLWGVADHHHPLWEGPYN